MCICSDVGRWYNRTVARKSSIGGFTFVEGLEIIIFDKSPLIYSVSYFNLVCLESFLGRKAHQSPRMAMGLH